MPEAYPYEVPPGYQEGMSGGSYNPETGERTSFALPPQLPRIPPPAIQELNQAALVEGLKSGKVDEALKQINAAQYFLGSRLLKQAQENNDTTGMMRATMMMFPRNPQASVNLLKAILPPVVPQITPYQAARLEIERQKASAASPSNIPATFDRDPNKEYITKGGALIPKVKPDATAFQTIRETIPATEATPAVEAVPFKKRDLFGIPFTDRLVPDQAEVKAKPAVAARGEQVITRRVPVSSQSEPVELAAPKQSVTKQEYESLKSGEKYWWNGKEYTKK